MHSGMIETKHSATPDSAMPSCAPSAHDPDAIRMGVGTTVCEAEKMLILKTLESTSNNKNEARKFWVLA